MVTTSRLQIKHINKTDVGQLVRMLQDDIIKRTYMIPDLRADEAEQLAMRFITLSTDPNHYVRGIYQNETLIGWLNDTEISGSAMEIGWAIRSDLHNNGFATEAVKAVISHLFSCGYTEIIAGAFIENSASIRVMEKVGMTHMNKTDEVTYRGITHTCVYFHAVNSMNWL